jgi:ABC-2 type transport system permease protein
MKKLFLVYKMLLYINIASLMAYRANFINSVISSFGWGFFSIVMMVLLTSKTPSIYGWSREEILLLTGFYNIIGGAFHVLFTRNFERFAMVLHKGDLDTLLIKPMDSQFLLSFWLFNYVGLFRILLGIVFSAYILVKIQGSIPFHIIPLTIFLSLAGIIILYSLSYMLLTLTVWYTSLSNIVGVMYELNGLTRYPPDIFTKIKSFFIFLLLPLTLAVSIPVKSLLGKLTWIDGLLLIGFAAGLFFCSRIFWKFALRSYTSASS